jgi:hypothetical protein
MISALLETIKVVTTSSYTAISLVEMDERSKELIAQITWALGNIAGDSLDGVRLLLDLDALIILNNIGKVSLLVPIFYLRLLQYND